MSKATIRKLTRVAKGKKVAKAKSPATKRQSAAPVPREVRKTSKLATVAEMLRSGEGATIESLCKATGWQAHSVRGAIAGALKKKQGLEVISEKTDGMRVYRVAS